MRRGRPVLGGCALAALMALSGPTALAETWSEEVEARPGERLEIDLSTGGTIRVEGWSENRVSMSLESRADIDYEFERVRDGVRIRVLSKGFSSRPSGVELVVRVPDRFDLDLETLGGTIVVKRVDGEIVGETMGGDLELDELRGNLDLSTLGGNIRLSNSEVDGRVKSAGGNVSLSHVSGTVDAMTLGGNVLYDNVRPGADGGEVEVTTLGGNIRVPDAPYGAQLETMGGNIHVEQAAEFVKAKTMGGDIFIGAVDGWIRASTLGGRIEATMVGGPGGGDRDVRLSAMGGDVILTLPEGMSMEIDITLAYTKKSDRQFEIESEFPLQIRRTDRWDYRDSAPRKYVYGTASIDGGRHKVKIETTDGNIVLRKN